MKDNLLCLQISDRLLITAVLPIKGYPLKSSDSTTSPNLNVLKVIAENSVFMHSKLCYFSEANFNYFAMLA